MKLPWSPPAVKPFFVSVPVPPDDPLLMLKKNLDWIAILEVFTDAMRAAGRNVDGLCRGRRTDVKFWLPVVILSIVLGKNSRELEELLTDSAKARCFVGFQESKVMQPRDHSSVHRMFMSLAISGAYEKINALVVGQAQALGFTNAEILSADTTAQQANIAYPNEPNILAMASRSVLAIVKQLKIDGRKKLGDLKEAAKKLLLKAKEYALFAKGREQKNKVLQQMLKVADKVLVHGRDVQTRISTQSGLKVASLNARLKHIGEGLQTLLPQIRYWLATGDVAKDKIVHIGMSKIRSMLRHKPGKKCEFGIKQLIVMLTGGYLLSQEVSPRSAEANMVDVSLSVFQNQFGNGAVPGLFVYDRGGWSKKNVQTLKNAGVKKIGIQPRGRARWRVHGEDRQEVLRHRSRTEGKIGTLKGSYGMERSKERRHDAFRAVTPRAVLSFNLNKTMKNLVAGRK
jgi:hypothetical protein